ncbi:MAG: NfeD family protein [Bacteroidetes bacterium]|nr:NfeD family protein [Bacteroidota bacterium]
MEFLSQMELLERAFWYVAIPASIIFILQSVMTFLGTDSHDGTQADFSGNLDGNDAPFQLFSFRNLINFLLGFSWSGISFYSIISNKLLLVVVCLMVGASFVYLFFFIIKNLMRLSEDNSLKLTSALNQTAEVYLKIPASKNGKGKIMVSINGSFHELDAMTNGEAIPTGAIVKVVSIDNNILIVNKF